MCLKGRLGGEQENHQDFLAGLTLPSSLAISPLFRNLMIWHDTLHVIYRGFLPEFCGSIIVCLGRERFWAPNKTLGENLAAAYTLCSTFLKTQKIGSLSLDEFSADSFLDELGFPSLPGKAVDAKLVALWLPSQTKLYVASTGSDKSKVMDVHFCCIDVNFHVEVLFVLFA